MSIENPAVPLDKALFNLFGTNASGQPVTVERCLGLPALFRGAKLISGKLGRIPCHVVKRTGGINVIDENHPANWLIQRPNRHFGKRTLFSVGTLRALLEGNAYFEIFRNDAGMPIALDPIDTVTPILVDDELYYKVEEDRVKRILGADRILHIKNLQRNAYVGLSCIDILADALGNSLAIQKYSATYFRKMAQIGYVIEVPTMLDPEVQKQTKTSFNEFHQGLDSTDSFGLAIVQGGSKLTQIQLDAEKAQLLETKEFDIVTIANVLGVPVHKLGSARNSSYNSLMSEEQAFLNDTLEDWLDVWAEEIELKLLTERQKSSGSHFVDWDRAVLVKADIELEHKISLNELNNGLVTHNEWLVKHNRPTIEASWADLHRMPVQLQFAEQIAAAKPSEVTASQPVATNPDVIENFEPETTPISEDDLRFSKLKDATMKRLNTRLEKAYASAVQKREDIDIEGHVAVFVDSTLFNEAEARDYIRRYISGTTI